MDAHHWVLITHTVAWLVQMLCVALALLLAVGTLIASQRYWLRGSFEAIKLWLRPGRKGKTKKRRNRQADRLAALTGENVSLAVVMIFALSALSSQSSVYHVSNALFRCE
jgi:hypothetical protein